MTKKQVKFVQQQLNLQGKDVGIADGLAGPKLLAELAQIDEIPPRWSKQRKVVGFIQEMAKQKGIDSGVTDGYWGPQTDFAFDSLQELLKEQRPPATWRPEDAPDINPNGWPSQISQEELNDFYGEIGKYQTRVQLPYPHKLAWNTRRTINSFICHEKVHDSLHRVLTQVLAHYGLNAIRDLHLDFWGGCYNERTMRGDTKPSLHSWAVAIDYYPQKNKLRWCSDRAVFAMPEYDEWWRIWESEGWVSLGKARNFDWMHVQAAKIC